MYMFGWVCDEQSADTGPRDMEGVAGVGDSGLCTRLGRLHAQSGIYSSIQAKH